MPGANFQEPVSRLRRQVESCCTKIIGVPSMILAL